MLSDLVGERPLPAAIERAPLDSDRFGLAIGRLSVPLGSTASIEDVVALVQASGLDVIVLRLGADRVTWPAALARTDRAVIHADTLVYWSVALDRVQRPPAGAFVADAASAEDGSLVDALVADLFGEYGNHYAANPLLDRALALAGYQEWARRTLVGGGAIVLRDDDERIALATVAVHGRHCEIELAGVAAARRGEGVYPHLLAAVADEAATRGCHDIVISTQVHNTVVQRAWASFGMRPELAVQTFHLVRPALLPT